MVAGGSENFPDIVPIYNPIIGGIFGADDNAYTSGMLQVYFMRVPYDFLFG